MTDNRTTELLCKLLEERGIEWKDGDASYEIEWSTPDGRHCSAMYWKPTFTVLISGCTPEQAIAATLGSEPPYDELLRCLEHDWNISASWDGLRKFWCIELTEEGVKLRDAIHGMLTAEQVRECVQHVYYDGYNDGSVHKGHGIEETNWQAIADELNAKFGGGTCKCVSEYAKSPIDGKTIVLHRCSSCHELMRPHMRFCPSCGAKVVD